MRITIWNTRSLGTRQGEIKATMKKFINNVSNDQDLIILTETRHLEPRLNGLKGEKLYYKLQQENQINL